MLDGVNRMESHHISHLPLQGRLRVIQRQLGITACACAGGMDDISWRPSISGEVYEYAEVGDASALAHSLVWLALVVLL